MGRKPIAGPENSFRPLCAIGFALSLHEIRVGYPAALVGLVSLRDCSMAQNEESHGKLVRRGRHPRPVRCHACPLIICALRPGKCPELVARGMIARVVRLPAFRSGLKSELAQRFCCRCPACDPSTRRLPRVAVPAFFPVSSLRNIHKLSPRRLPSAPLLHLVIVMLLLRAGGSAGLRGPLVASARSPALLGLAPFIAPLALRSPHIRLCAFRWRAGSLAAHRAGCLARSASCIEELMVRRPLLLRCKQFPHHVRV